MASSKASRRRWLGSAASWRLRPSILTRFRLRAFKSIRKSVAKSTAEFEEKFGIPAATMNNWEQGRRKPDPAGRLLLRVIEEAPGIVEQVAHKAA